MTHAEWVASRTPVAPAALVAVVGALLRDHPEWNALPRPDAFIAAAEALLARVLASAKPDRTCAVDLLSADACITYAFEAAADEPRTIAARAERAMRHIAAFKNPSLENAVHGT